MAAAQDGDTVAVQPGIYANDFAEISKKITLEGVGGFAHLTATGFIPNHKAILIADTNITIRNFWFSGARVSNADGANGAGIRFQGGNLVLDGCYFSANQNGILGDAPGTITITRSEFFNNGAKKGPSAGYTHNIYMGHLDRVTIRDSYFHGANIGHEIKSRAAVTTIVRTRVVDGPTGTASYSIDAPNGGVVTIIDSQIAQGPASQNPYIIAFGEEGGLHAASRLSIQGSLIENDLNTSSARAVLNPSNRSVTIADTKVFGLTRTMLANGAATLNGVAILKTEPPISTLHPWLQ